MAEIPLATALESAASRHREGDEWTVSRDGPAGATLSLPDRTLVVRHRDGPEGAERWTVDLAAGGATVSKFGPFESVPEAVERVESLLEGDVSYTVCCDG
jgi:hypothetical protein